MTAQPIGIFDPTPDEACAEPLPLSALAPGQSAIVVDVDASSPGGRRLLDLGFLPGTRVDVVRRAPLGDPVSYRLRGYTLCLRREQCAVISVRLSPAERG